MSAPERQSDFGSRFWEILWNSRVPNLDSLREYARNDALVVMDVRERGSNGRIGEIGLTLIRPKCIEHTNSSAQSLRWLCESAAMLTHYIRVDSYFESTRRDVLCFDAVGHRAVLNSVDDMELEERLGQIIRSFRESLRRSPLDVDARTGRPGGMVLVGFDMLRSLQGSLSPFRYLPGIFGTCVDLKTIMKDVAENPDQHADFGLRDALLSVGFQPRTDVLVGANDGTNTANNAIRIAGLLARLVTRPPSKPIILHKTADQPRPRRMTWNSNRLPRTSQSNYFEGQKPEPIACFPFIATLTLNGAEEIVPQKNAAQIHEDFSDFHPSGVGSFPVGCPAVGAWLAFETVDELRLFLFFVSHARLFEGGGIWVAEALYDEQQHQRHTERLEQEKNLADKAAEKSNYISVARQAKKEMARRFNDPASETIQDEKIAAAWKKLEAEDREVFECIDAIYKIMRPPPDIQRGWAPSG